MVFIKCPLIHTRYSTNLQRDNSCEDQEREAREILRKHSIDDSNAIVIHDRAESGTKSQRDGFQQLQKLVAQGRVSVVVVDDQARLSRGDDVIGVIKNLVFSGVRFLSGDGVDTDDEGWQLKVRVLGLHNATTIDETARRVRRGQRGRILDDLSAGDFPYGFESYFLDPDYALKFCGRGPKPDKGIRICKSESYWVREVFQLFIDGSSINAIAQELTRRQAPTGNRSKGKKWYPNRIRHMLQNEKYAGTNWTWGATTTIRDANGKTKQVPVPEAEITRRERPALQIIDPEIWQSAQEKLARLKEIYGLKEGQKKRGPKVHHTVAYPQDLLSDLLVCGYCGSKMHYNRSGQRVYRLCKNSGNGSDFCNHKTRIPADKTKAVLLEFITKLLDRMPEWVSAALETMKEAIRQSTTRLSGDITQLERQLRDVETRRDNLFALGEAGNIASETFQQRLQELEAELAKLRSDLESAETLRSAEIDLPDEQWVASQLNIMADLIVGNKRQAALLFRKLLGKVRVYRVQPPGKSRGYQQLKFTINAWELICEALQQKIPSQILQFVSRDSGLADCESPEFCLEVGGPTRMDELAPRIAELRQAKVPWKEICKQTGLGLGPAYTCWKRYVDSQAEESSAGDINIDAGSVPSKVELDTAVIDDDTAA